MIILLNTKGKVMGNSNSKSKKNKAGYSQILFYVAGLLLIIKFFMEGGIPSPSSNLLNFIVGLFTVIVIIGFYCFFIFGGKGCSGTIKALAPALLLLILYGKYSLNFGNADINKYLVSIANMVWLLIILCGFVFLFIRNKVISTVFTYSVVVYASFVSISYTVMAIINAVNGSKFSINNFISVLLLILSLACIGVGSFFVSKHQSIAINN